MKSIAPFDRPFVFRKDLARLLCLSTEVIRANEHMLGLDIARRVVNERVVLYDTLMALHQLSLRGMLPSTMADTGLGRSRETAVVNRR